jgi:hypothetical protein
MSDATSSPAQALADHGQRPEPFREGVLHMRELPLADDRTAANHIIRGADAASDASIGTTGDGLVTHTDVHGELTADTSERALTDAEIVGLSFLFVIAGFDWHRRIPGHWAAPGASVRISWPAPLVGADDLLLIFPPGGGEAGRD